MYPDMAVSYEIWPSTEESTFSYCSGQPGPSYAAAFNLPMTSEYGTLPHLQGFADSQSQAYVRMYYIKAHNEMWSLSKW